jgi:signal transduction histidine kinase
VRLQTSGYLRGEWDGNRMTQVVCNLIGNAIQQHGGGTPVTLTAHEDGESVTLAGHNGGPPIPPDVLPVVFEPLARGHGDTGGHSIGLGLFIARGDRVSTFGTRP